MNYEELYQKLQVLEKTIGDKQTSSQKHLKSLRRDSETGDLKSYAKDLALLQDAVREQAALLYELKSLTEGFDIGEYIESGDFSEQMVYECRRLSVDVKGDFPVFEMFPYKVKIDEESQDIFIDRKKLQCLRPSSFAKVIKTSRERLLKASFNAASFANELCAAYDLAMTIKNKNTPTAQNDSDISLKDLYTYMAPMQRYRREYDMQAFAFDLSRLYDSDTKYVKDGRQFQFGSSKQPKKLIRILDANGHEQFLATIRFFRENE